ncbi:MAG: T9SS type A sorting domain-containing protein, partial [Bacteroidales bacterium]|nr:T9SS type A sorting domain-containing protein [Bacteroidales bacterium]
YQIDVLSVDGNEVELTEEQLSGFTYTFEPVMSDMTFSVTFTRLNVADMLEAGSIAVYPNPNNGKFILSMESIEGDVTCQIVNANGSVIETREMSATDGSEFVFDCNVAPGAYFVRVISGDRVWTKSVVINR